MMSWFTEIIGKAENVDYVGSAVRETSNDGIFKAYIPNFLYKPPYGMPRKVNTQQLKALAKNPYVFSVIKTMCDEATTIDWSIQVKKEFQEEGVDYQDKIDEITKFFRNPNGNEQSFEHILRQLITDILEIDAGVIVKVFNAEGEFKQIFARDGATFLKNPNIYGYMGDKADFVPPLPDGFDSVPVDLGGTPNPTQQQMMKQYNMLYKQDAAYFQYGWTAGSMPVPFGKREIIYIMQNPRADSIYGRSPIEVLTEVVLNLIYGADFNLDYYTNNNMPEGVIQLLGAQREQIEQFRDNFEGQFKYTDSLGYKRKKFFKFPIASTEVKFTPFQLTSQDLQVLEQQKWFTKIMWMCFGVTADEMGFSEDSNKAIATEQAKIFKRKAIKPLLNVIQYHINTELITEFFSKDIENQNFSDIPLLFKFDTYDEDEDLKIHNILEQEIRMGVKTSEMAAEELGINVEELREKKEEREESTEQQTPEKQGDEDDNNKNNNNDIKEDNQEKEEQVPEDKALETEIKPETEVIKDPLSEIDKFIDGIGDALIQAVDNIDENEL